MGLVSPSILRPGSAYDTTSTNKFGIKSLLSLRRFLPARTFSRNMPAPGGWCKEELETAGYRLQAWDGVAWGRATS